MLNILRHVELGTHSLTNSTLSADELVVGVPNTQVRSFYEPAYCFELRSNSHNVLLLLSVEWPTSVQFKPHSKVTGATGCSSQLR